MHVIPRYDDDPLQLPVRPQEGDPDEIKQTAEKLRLTAVKLDREGDVGIIGLDAPPLNLFDVG